jgi:hypothetical protein
MDVSQASKPGEWAVLISHFPGHNSEPIGVIVRDAAHDHLEIKLRQDWWSKFSEGEGIDLWSGLAEDIRQQALEMGAKEYLDWFEYTCSHVLRISSRRSFLFQDARVSLESLYKREVEGRSVKLASAQVESEQSRKQAPNTLSKVRALVSQFDQTFAFVRTTPLFQNWRLQSVLATCLLAVALFVTRAYHQPKVGPIAQFSTEAFASFELPPVGFHREILALNLDSTEPWIIETNRHNNAKMHESAHRKFLAQLRSPKVPVVQVARIDRIPAPHIAPEVRPVAEVAMVDSLPSVPHYRSRNKLIRVLSAIGRSFRDDPKPATLLTLAGRSN